MTTSLHSHSNELRAIIWLQCVVSAFFVVLAVCDVNRCYLPLPELHNVLVKMIAGLTIYLLFILGVTIPFAIIIDGLRKRIPARIWLGGFALTLPFAVLQVWAIMLLCM